MPRSIPALPRALPLCLALFSVSSFAQAVPPQAPSTPVATVVEGARALYYTPADQGLEGFQCEVGFDWKTFLQKANHAAIPDDDPRLHYLQTIRLSVEDTLRGKGELHWAAPAPPPDGTAASVDRIREGFQQIWSGFFQSWNGFFTGDLLAVDGRASVERVPAGYRVSVQSGSGTAEETFDSNLVLQQLHVATPTLDSVVVPQFSPTPHGLLVTSIHSSYKQPPTAEPTDLSMQVRYAAVNGFQLPSELTVSVGPADFDWQLKNCTTTAKLTQ